MDVSGWTVDQLMRLPDWCFGNRQLIGCYVYTVGPGTLDWGISDIALPDPACIWEFSFQVLEFANQHGDYRAGLSHTLPASEGQMDATQEFYPHWGRHHAGPNYILCGTYIFTYVTIPFKRGIVTGGKKLVVEAKSWEGTARIHFSLLVSGLPTSMAGWLAHNKV